MLSSKRLAITFLWAIGRFWSFFYSFSLSKKLIIIRNKFYTAWLSRELKEIDKLSTIQYPIELLGGKYISIGQKTCIGKRAILTAWDKHGLDSFIPSIIIGNDVSIGDDCHITAINRIEIGNNVLTGKKITITDNSHGRSIIEHFSFPPENRPLHSDGPVIIEEGVWIGDKVTILPNVRIGGNAIIGANSVVSKDIQANCVAVGIPAKVIKIIE